VLAGALAGVLGARPLLATLASPGAVDPARWTVLVPGLSEDVVTPNLGRGMSVAGGVLSIIPHSFGRSDRMMPRDQRPFARLEIELAPDSGPLSVNLVPPPGDPRGVALVVLVPQGFIILPGDQLVPVAQDGPAVLLNDGQQVLAMGKDGPVRLVSMAPGSLELSATRGEARVRSVRALDATGDPIVEEHWDAEAVPVAGRLLLGLGGALLGLLAGIVATQGPPLLALGLGEALVLLLPVALVLLASRGFWLAAVERLFLVRTTTWDLSRLALLVACLPLLTAALLRLGLLRAHEPGPRQLPPALPWAVLVLVDLAGARSLGPWSLLVLPLGLALLATPRVLVRRARLDPTASLAMDLPALLAVAVLGWPAGLLLLVAWRLLLVAAWVPVLLKRAPRAGADALFLGLLLLPLSTELLIRHSYLDTAWDAARLSGEALGAGEDASGVHAYWSDRCGQAPATLWWLGGSSAGGAYQLQGEPAAFFPGVVHDRLCAQGVAVQSVNSANGGRDSFTFSRALPELLAQGKPDLVVLYLGVNDLLTANSPLTRKEREAAQARQEQGQARLQAIAAHSRLLSGLGLLARPVAADPRSFVAAIPVADAEENLRDIIAGVRAGGGRVLLVPELTQRSVAGAMAPYREMEAQVAATEPGTSWIDVVQALDGPALDGLMVDRNHLSREGHVRVAELLTPTVAALLAPPTGG